MFVDEFDVVVDDPLISTKTVAGLYPPEVAAMASAVTWTGDSRVDDFPDL